MSFDVGKFEKAVDSRLSSVPLKRKDITINYWYSSYMKLDTYMDQGPETGTAVFAGVTGPDKIQTARAYFALLSQRSNVWGAIYGYPRCHFIDAVSADGFDPKKNQNRKMYLLDFDKVLILTGTKTHLSLIEVIIPRLLEKGKPAYIRYYSTMPGDGMDSAKNTAIRALELLCSNSSVRSLFPLGDHPNIGGGDAELGNATIMAHAQVIARQQFPETHSHSVDPTTAVLRMEASVYIERVPHIVPFDAAEQSTRSVESGISTPLRLSSIINFINSNPSITSNMKDGDNSYYQDLFNDSDEDSDDAHDLSADSSDLEEMLAKGITLKLEGEMSDESVDG